MKPKVFKKTLHLNKNTIVNLSHGEMEHIGGAPPKTVDTWCEGSCYVPIGDGSGCFSYPRGFACVCDYIG